jgi:hypothetical protein
VRPLLAALACACAGLAATAPASAITFGVTEDDVKGRPGLHYPALVDLGMRENTISVMWHPDNPTALPGDLAQIDTALAQAAAHGIKVSFAIYQRRPAGLSSATSRVLLAQYTTWLQALARRFPSVTEYIGPNEPNLNRFWQPQFTHGCVNASGAAYARVMAATYDALKSVSARIEVVGMALSPRGNDNCLAPRNASTSPVRFLHFVGRAYRRSDRKRPLMDSLSFHPYPASNTDHPLKGYRWPNVGAPNFDRLKQAVHDAFAGTAQPTVEQGLKIRVHESGHETATGRLPAYRGVEEVAPVDEAIQARYYEQLVRFFACDPTVESFNFFHLMDESNREGLQSGLLRPDGSRKPSYDAVKAAIARAQTGCAGKAARWEPATSVIGAHVNFDGLQARLAAEEETTFSAGLFRVTGALTKAGRTAISRSLASARAPARETVAARGSVRAYYSRLVRARVGTLAPGTYVHAVKLTAATNPARSSIFVSPPFAIGARGNH